MPKLRFIFSIFFLFLSLPALAEETIDNIPHNPQPFGLWVMELKLEARAAGVSASLLEQAFTDMMPDGRVIELDRKQPEGTRTFTDYLATAVSDKRIRTGREKYREHKALLERVSKDYGVQPRFIVALWGIETNFGGYTGHFSVIEALATLAYDGRRSDFFRKELIKALQIVDAGHISLVDMEGSWAGAMGQCQFMPSSFLNFAVDYDGDGKKDIWNSLPDIFASIANYLKQNGWNDELTWGREVRMPASFSDELADGKQFKPLSQWQRLGVRNADGSDLPKAPLEAALSMPGERDERIFLVYRNHDVLLHWNRSRYFASAVGLLSDEVTK